MRLILSIGLGSFIGGISRYLLSGFIQSKLSSILPYGTLMVNILGCFLIGILYGVSERMSISDEWKLIIATGLLGGFTTFSAFSMESIQMLRQGQVMNSIGYVLLSVTLGLLATWLGISFLKTI
jgi:fluoride exporter